jgi:hypothetical protein
MKRSFGSMLLVAAVLAWTISCKMAGRDEADIASSQGASTEPLRYSTAYSGIETLKANCQKPEYAPWYDDGIPSSGDQVKFRGPVTVGGTRQYVVDFIGNYNDRRHPNSFFCLLTLEQAKKLKPLEEKYSCLNSKNNGCRESKEPSKASSNASSGQPDQAKQCREEVTGGSCGGISRLCSSQYSESMCNNHSFRGCRWSGSYCSGHISCSSSYSESDCESKECDWTEEKKKVCK